MVALVVPMPLAQKKKPAPTHPNNLRCAVKADVLEPKDLVFKFPPLDGTRFCPCTD